MSGVCGYERRCHDTGCPYSVCDGCPIAEALDAAGIRRTESWEQTRDVLDWYVASMQEEKR